MRVSIPLRVASVVALIATFPVVSPAVAADKPEANTVQRVRPYLQPAVVAVDRTYSGIVYDSFVQAYIGEEGFVASPRRAANVTIHGGVCTGYAVSSTGHIATAGHCVDPAEHSDDILKALVEYAQERYNDYYDGPPVSVDELIDTQGYEVRHGTGEKGPDASYDIYWDVATGDIKAGESHSARVLDFMSFEKGDGALLKTEVRDNFAVSLSSSEIDVGKEIVAIGYPGSLEAQGSGFDKDLRPSYNDGKISGEATRGGRLFKAYEHTAKTNGGMSGGPVADASGGVIGFNSFGIPDDTFISYARPASIIQELMDDEGVENSLNAASTNFRDGLDAYFNGERDQAVELLTKASEADDDNSVASEFLAKAEALEGSTNWFLVLVLPVVGLVLVAAVARMVVNRRRNASSEPGGAASFGSVDQTGAPPQPALAAATVGESTEPSASPVGVGTEPPAAKAGEPCPKCGDATQADEKFCSNCGMPLR